MKKIITAALIIILSITLFAMSGDGGQQPVKPEKKTEVVQTNSEQENLTKKITRPVTSESVIYRYSDPVPIEKSGLKNHFNPKGIYAYEKFKSPDQPEGAELERLYLKYKKKFFDLGLKAEGVVSVLFYNKINLHKIDEFKTLGIDLYELDKRQFESINNKEAILYSKICITGTVIDSISNPDPKSSYHTLYKIEVDKMYKGGEYYNKIPILINYYSPVGKVLIGGSKEVNMRPRARVIEHIGEKVCLGLIQNMEIELKLDSVSFDVIKFVESEDLIKKFEEINNSKDFFKEVSK